jgi:WD40 repeat protein
MGSLVHTTAAEVQLQKLKDDGDENKKALYQACRQSGPGAYPLKVSLQELGSPSLLERVQSIPDVDTNIRMLRTQRIKGRINTVYIPLQAKPSLQATDDNKFDLMKKINEFLKGDQEVLDDDQKESLEGNKKKSLEGNQEVFLLLGDSGAGKSTFMRELENLLWQSYESKADRIPIHINLPSIDKPEHDLIAKQLRKADFTEPQIREMKRHRKILLICDGYDESQLTHNLYMSNKLNQPGEWNARMIISCRTEYLGTDYQDRFIPGDHNQQSNSSLFQEAVILPFSPNQIQTYIKEYVSINRPLWRSEDYEKVLNHISTLKELVRNPFLMALSMEVLPHMMDPNQDLSTAHITRVGLYDHFVKQWLERSKKQIAEKDLTPQSRATFKRLSDEGFVQHGIDFMKKLAVAIYKEQGGRPVVEYSQFMDEGSWKDVFFLRKDKQLLREACPLTRNGNQHRFIHRSLLEYGLARAVFDPHDRRNRTMSEPIMGRRGSATSIHSFQSQKDIKTEGTIIEQEPDINSPLVWRSFVNDYSLLQFLAERVQQEPVFKKQLLDYIEYSKTDDTCKWRKAAANAITVLVRAGVRFIGTDFQKIRIPGADLSYGTFDSAQLQGADLRMVNFRGSWLRQTDMSKARMAGSQFGELPFITVNSDVRSCGFSPDRESLAVGLDNGDINIYAVLDWEKIRTLTGHTGLIWCVVYSPRGDQIASSSVDKTVRLWDSKTGLLQYTLTAHTDWVRCVAYLPQGNQVASASDDGTIRLWNKDTGVCSQILSGHTHEIRCIACSPNSQQIVSGSSDCTVRLWNVETRNSIHILSGHTNTVWAVGYSPRGDQVASASEDQTIRLWRAENGECSFILRGHMNAVYSIVYSPKGDQLASGSVDAAVRLWDTETGHCRQILTGHNNTVFSVVYSPDGNRIASGGDTTVRLWDVSAGGSRFISSGHTMEANSVKCSSLGNLIVSGSSDWTIRVWDVDTGACRRTMSGHENSVSSVAFSTQGNVASGGTDNTVRLWNVETGECLSDFRGHKAWVECVAFSPRGDMIASASADKTVRLWNVETGQHKTLKGHTDGVLSVAYSPDGTQIATGSMDKTARIWNIGTRKCLQILEGHTEWVRDVAFSPKGNQLASAGYDSTIRLWNVGERECCLTLSGHGDRVKSIAYSQQGDMLASGSWDKTVRLWDVASGQCRADIQNLPHAIHSVTWSHTSDGSFLVIGGKDGSVQRWDVKEEGEICSPGLRWVATNGTLTVTGVSIQDVHGLTTLKKQLLIQRGAIGEPENLLRVSANKLITMASVVSKLKQPSDQVLPNTPLATDSPEPERPVEEVHDS